MYPGFFSEDINGKEFIILSPQDDQQGEHAVIKVTQTAYVFDLLPSYYYLK